MSNYEYITEEELQKMDRYGKLHEDINKLLASKAQTGYCIVNEEECAYITSTAISKIRTPYNNGDSLDDTHIAHVFFEPLKPAEPECECRRLVEFLENVCELNPNEEKMWNYLHNYCCDCGAKLRKSLGGEK